MHSNSLKALGSFLIGLAATVGLGLALWPTAATAIVSDHLRAQARVYESQPAISEKSSIAKEQAQAINELLATRQQAAFGDAAAPDGYWSWLASTNGAMIATVSIPSLDLSLPVYLGTSDSVLAQGIGHLPGSSLPIGGPSTHCVLAGHTDYRDAELFTHISSLGPGDEVILASVAGTLVYRVVSQTIVEPSDVTALAIEPGADLLTLLTCYPPSINTQRLLVRCERDLGASAPSTNTHADTANDSESISNALAQSSMPGWIVAGWCFIGSLAFGILVGGITSVAFDRTSSLHVKPAYVCYDASPDTVDTLEQCGHIRPRIPVGSDGLARHCNCDSHRTKEKGIHSKAWRIILIIQKHLNII